MSQFYAGFSTNQTPTFVGYIRDEYIFYTDTSGQQVSIGVTTKVHDQLKADYDSIYARCQEYYDRLVKLGEIVPELTGDALIKAQADELAKAAKLIKQMSENQEHLLSVIRSMQQTPAPEDMTNEFPAHDCEPDAGNIPEVESNDHRVEPASEPVPQFKGGFTQGHHRKKSRSK